MLGNFRETKVCDLALLALLALVRTLAKLEFGQEQAEQEQEHPVSKSSVWPKPDRNWSRIKYYFIPS